MKLEKKTTQGGIRVSEEVKYVYVYGVPISVVLTLHQVRRRLEQVSSEGALWSSEPQHLAEMLWAVEYQLRQGGQSDGQK